MRAREKTVGMDLELPSAEAGDDWTWMVADDPAFSIDEPGGAPGRGGT